MSLVEKMVIIKITHIKVFDIDLQSWMYFVAGHPV